jgi:hypothetical protein
MRLRVSAIFKVFLDWLVIIKEVYRRILEDNQAYYCVAQEGQQVQVDAGL